MAFEVRSWMSNYIQQKLWMQFLINALIRVDPF